MKTNRCFNLTIFLLFFISLLTLFGCSSNNGEKGSPEYITQIKLWHQKRVENLKKENGWLNLAGLYWLKEGENTFGTNPGNDIVFPKGKAPGIIGIFTLKDSTVTMKINTGVKVTSNNRLVKEMKLKTDLSGDPTVLTLGFLKWFIIKRGDKYGVRLRDLSSELLTDFAGIDTYPINEDWKITARFEPYDPPKSISIPTIIGTVDEYKVLGALVFEKNGIQYKLDPVEEGAQFFIIFADETSGKETYGAGRFIYTNKPDSAGNVILDFNKAYNPPCAFTPYATCPLPPKQNYLKLMVTAGEKKYGNY
jgi:uncharacterized protein (DUF1684 family)